MPKFADSVHWGQGCQDASTFIQDPDTGRCSGLLGRLCDPLPPAIASIIRYHLVYNDVDGLAGSYDSLRYKSPKAELNLLNRWVRSGQNAARGHREKVAEIISSLFKDTPHDEALVHVKKSVFNVDGGSAIMTPNHPAMIELLSQPKDDTASFVPLLNVTC